MKPSACILFVFMIGLSLRSYADTNPLRLTIGESKLLHVESAKKVAVGNPGVVDVTSVSDQEILISAKSAGNTSLIFISPSGDKETRAIMVSSHNLKKSMVEVGVEIMEIESQSALKAGLSWGSISNSGSSGIPSITSNNLSVSENSPPPLLTVGSLSRQALSANVQLLIERGKAKILAKPKLLAVSGEEASFLAGGEVPYVTENKLGSTNIQWKPYGVKLKIKPTIDGDGNISANLRAEVSGLDIQNGTAIGTGIVVPALKTRWVETAVYMKSGSTLVIAGLISEENQKLTSGIPLLSDIPIIGELFRFTDNRQSQTELVIFVTPSLVGQTDEGS
jgi:Flp pilus assembly secretin CpaC